MKSFEKATEAQIEYAILDYLVRIKHIFAWKQPTSGFFDTKHRRFRKQASPFAINGVPDIIAVIYGRFIGFEVKRRGNKQTEAQKLFESRLRASQGLYYILHDLLELEDALADIELKLLEVSLQ